MNDTKNRINDFLSASTPIFFALILVFAVNLYLTDTLNAQDRRTHTVRQGETLFSISRQYEVTVEQIKAWNNLSGNQISTGQQLHVSPPGSGPAPARTAPETPAQTPAQVPVTPSPAQTSDDSEVQIVRHRVQSGETLFSLSRRYGVSVNDIKRWNNLSGELLEIGQNLEIRASRHNIIETAAGMQVEDGSSVISSTGASSAYHIVKAGDSLTRIASDNNISIDELRDLNRLQSDRLSVGQVLLVRRPQGLPSVASGTATSTAQGRFTSYQVRSGERLIDILRKFEMTENEFKALNSDINVNDIRQGLEISVLLPPNTTYKNPYRSSATTTSEEVSESLRATRYAENDRGRPTTNGDLYNPAAYTAAHNRLPLGSVVYVENVATDVGLFVLINDRIVENGIKLSHATFDMLGFGTSSDNAVIIKTTRE